MSATHFDRIQFTQLNRAIDPFSVFHQTDEHFVINLCRKTSEKGPTVLGKWTEMPPSVALPGCLPTVGPFLEVLCWKLLTMKRSSTWRNKQRRIAMFNCLNKTLSKRFISLLKMTAVFH